mgnify:CR=1 FL=1
MYLCQPKGWRDHDLKMLDRCIAAFSELDPLATEGSVQIDLFQACASSRNALYALKKYLAENGRKLQCRHLYHRTKLDR